MHSGAIARHCAPAFLREQLNIAYTNAEVTAERSFERIPSLRQFSYSAAAIYVKQYTFTRHCSLYLTNKDILFFT